MNLKVEHGIIAVLVVALLYIVYTHRSLLSDLSLVPHDNNPQLKAVKDKHDSNADCDSSCYDGEGIEKGGWLDTHCYWCEDHKCKSDCDYCPKCISGL